MALELWSSAEQVRFDAEGLHFREWVAGDARNMVRLFDTEQMDRWTPLPSPFTEVVANEYVVSANHSRRRNGTLQLAVCPSATGPAIAELLIFPSEHPDAVELAYAVGSAHQRQKVATRSVCAALHLARTAGACRALLSIAADNHASRATAAASGFSLTGTPLRERRRKGYLMHLQTWAREL